MQVCVCAHALMHACSLKSALSGTQTARFLSLGGAGQRPPPPGLRRPHYRDPGREQSGPLFPVRHLPGVCKRVLAGGHHHLCCRQSDRPAGDHRIGQRH